MTALDIITDALTEPDSSPSIHIAPAPRPNVLGPNQLAWCRDKLAPFETCERQALEAQAHRDALLAKVRQ
jgi:hypothetical protein